MAAVGVTRLPHPRPGRAAAVCLRLQICQGKSLLILQLISRGSSTIRCLVDAGGRSGRHRRLNLCYSLLHKRLLD